jgi:hypothetical protein
VSSNPRIPIIPNSFNIHDSNIASGTSLQKEMHGHQVKDRLGYKFWKKLPVERGGYSM